MKLSHDFFGWPQTRTGGIQATLTATLTDRWPCVTIIASASSFHFQPRRARAARRARWPPEAAPRNCRGPAHLLSKCAPLGVESIKQKNTHTVLRAARSGQGGMGMCMCRGARVPERSCRTISGRSPDDRARWHERAAGRARVSVSGGHRSGVSIHHRGAEFGPITILGVLSSSTSIAGAAGPWRAG